jgi:membrane protein
VAAGAVITAFNIAFDARESRGLVKANLVALLITLGAVIGIGAVGAASAFAAGAFEGAAGSIAVFLLVGLVGAGGAAAGYRVVPNVDDVGGRASLGGGLLFAIGWMLASAGLGFYAANFANYDATYGSLGAIVVFLTWLYLSAYLLLMGAHLAATIAERDRVDIDPR